MRVISCHGRCHRDSPLLATYDNARRKQTEKLQQGTDTSRFTNSSSFIYYPNNSGNGFAGQLDTVTDWSAGIVTTYAYDQFAGRVAWAYGNDIATNSECLRDGATTSGVWQCR